MFLWVFSLGRPRRSRDIQEIKDDGPGGSRWALCHLFFFIPCGLEVVLWVYNALWMGGE
jgi:hypothetical protein